MDYLRLMNKAKMSNFEGKIIPPKGHENAGKLLCFPAFSSRKTVSLRLFFPADCFAGSRKIRTVLKDKFSLGVKYAKIG